MGPEKALGVFSGPIRAGRPAHPLLGVGRPAEKAKKVTAQGAGAFFAPRPKAAPAALDKSAAAHYT